MGGGEEEAGDQDGLLSCLPQEALFACLSGLSARRGVAAGRSDSARNFVFLVLRSSRAPLSASRLHRTPSSADDVALRRAYHHACKVLPVGRASAGLCSGTSGENQLLGRTARQTSKDSGAHWRGRK